MTKRPPRSGQRGRRSVDGPPRPEVHAINEAIKSQREAFEAKFGRPPGPNEPIWFDPDEPEPTPMPPEKARAQMVHWMLQAGIPHRLVYVYLRTDGMIVDQDHYKRLSEDQRAAWDSAVAEYAALTGEEPSEGVYIHEYLAANGTLRSGGWLVPIGGGTPVFEIDGEMACEFAADDIQVLRRITRLLVNESAWFMVLPIVKEDGLWGLFVQKVSAALVENELERHGLYLTRGPHTDG